MTVLDLLTADGFSLRKAGRTKGRAEFEGPCPWCGGRDRFRVWPEEATKAGTTGRYWCRRCEKTGDSIQYLRDRHGMSYPEACKRLGIDSGDGKRGDWIRGSYPPKVITPDWIPSKLEPPSVAWSDRALRIRDAATACLWSETPTARGALAWLRNRGIDERTAMLCGLGYRPETTYEDRSRWGLPEETNEETGRPRKVRLPAGIVIPAYREGVGLMRLRVRRRNADRKPGDSSYVMLPGGSSAPFDLSRGRFHADPGGSTFVIVESELDGVMLSGTVGDLVGVIALGSAQLKPDEDLDRRLRRARKILVALDADSAGAKAAWKFWHTRYPQSERWPTVNGKDPGDAYEAGLDVRAWIEAGL